jgi:Rieske Fe-S protein
MMDEDQDHFADYLELEHYIEDLQTEQAAHLPLNLTPEQARIYRMTVLFHSTSPAVSEASQPCPDFITTLQERLLSISQEVEAPDQKERPTQAHQTDQNETEHQQLAMQQQPSPAPKASTPSEHPRKARFMSRRKMLANGAVAAASLAVGIGAGTMMDKSQPPQPTTYKQEELIPTCATTWQFVAPLTQLTTQATKFSTDTITYYVRLNDDNDKDKEPVIAVSASCTHMGCTLRWDSKTGQFQCPCHGGLFDEYGLPAKESPLPYLKPLPCLKTKIEDGNVYVEVPTSQQAT